MGVKFTLVEDLGGVSADFRMQPPAAVQEEAQFPRHHLRPVQDVGKDRPFGAGRVGALEGLVKLLGIAQQDKVRGAGGRCDRVRQ